jgi:hypothetical protein
MAFDENITVVVFACGRIELVEVLFFYIGKACETCCHRWRCHFVSDSCFSSLLENVNFLNVISLVDLYAHVAVYIVAN